MESQKSICLITNAHISYNPRLLKEADALCRHGFEVIVTSVVTNKQRYEYDQQLMKSRKWTLCIIDVRKEKGTLLKYLLTSLRYKLLQFFPNRFFYLDMIEVKQFKYHFELYRLAKKQKADLYIAHNVEALPIAAKVAKKYNAKLGFDLEDFYRGGFQKEDSPKLYNQISYIEEKYIPLCDYITSSSDQITAEYQKIFSDIEPVTILNVFNLSDTKSLANIENERRIGQEKISLYWFSQTIGLDRGLQDIIHVLPELGQYFHLHIRGSWSSEEHKQQFLDLINKYNIVDQVHFLEPAPPEEMVIRAAQHDIGLALELNDTINHNICLSNKIFTYILSGLIIIATNTKGQKEIVDKYNLGFVYTAGDLKRLASILKEIKLKKLQNRNDMKNHVRDIGTNDLNWEKEQIKFIYLIKKTLNIETTK